MAKTFRADRDNEQGNQRIRQPRGRGGRFSGRTGAGVPVENIAVEGLMKKLMDEKGIPTVDKKSTQEPAVKVEKAKPVETIAPVTPAMGNVTEVTDEVIEVAVEPIITTTVVTPPPVVEPLKVDLVRTTPRTPRPKKPVIEPAKESPEAPAPAKEADKAPEVAAEAPAPVAETPSVIVPTPPVVNPAEDNMKKFDTTNGGTMGAALWYEGIAADVALMPAFTAAPEIPLKEQAKAKLEKLKGSMKDSKVNPMNWFAKKDSGEDKK